MLQKFFNVYCYIHRHCPEHCHYHRHCHFGWEKNGVGGIRWRKMLSPPNKQLLDEVEHAKTEFNNCFIIHFSRNSSSETEAKRSAILFLRRTLQGA